ncbi:MAG TPA: lipopolysaccharide biosynthesis protein [Vicinamibacterales bacterium]|nr:lipopolysaccharide biosynthesis protein [Vicinamibacterales bacterium]
MLTRVTNLFRNVVIYGMGDAATSVVSLLLLPIFTSYLTPADYGVITMLLTIEAVTKVLFRWGVDTAFMRLYYDCADRHAQQRLASTIFLFLFTVNGVLVAAGIMSADWLSDLLFHTRAHAILIRLTLANTFVAGFFFIPFQVLRIGERSGQFVALSFSRSAGTIIARLLLVIGARMGVLGIVTADVAVTAILTATLTRWFAPLLRPVFSRTVLREALGFGLPRVPHSVAQQIIGFADRYFLNAYGTLRDVGLFSIGASFGLALKFFLGAFESAWTPFFLGLMRERDAKRVYSTVSTYVLAVLVLLVAGVCATAPAVVRLFTTAQFHGAAMVTPWIALGVMFQGIYLVGSIGLVITKRTKVYPISTGAAAAASVLANVLLIPRYGILGAAWANAIAYATLAAATVGASWYFYPIRYQWTRLLRIAVAGALSYAIVSATVPRNLAPVAGILLATIATTAMYALVLAASGFFEPGELRILRNLRWRTLQWNRAPLTAADTTPVEMAGDFIDTPAEPASISPHSQSPRR